MEQTEESGVKACVMDVMDVMVVVG